MIKYHNIFDSEAKKALRNVTVQTCLRIVSDVAIQNHLGYRMVYIVILTVSGNSVCRSTCDADGTYYM